MTLIWSLLEAQSLATRYSKRGRVGGLHVGGCVILTSVYFIKYFNIKRD